MGNGAPNFRKRPRHVAEVRSVRDGDKVNDGLPRQQRPDFMNLFDLIGAELRDIRAAVGDKLDQPFGLQGAQCFAQRRAADGQRPHQFRFDKLLPRRQMSLHDGVAKRANCFSRYSRPVALNVHDCVASPCCDWSRSAADAADATRRNATRRQEIGDEYHAGRSAGPQPECCASDCPARSCDS